MVNGDRIEEGQVEKGDQNLTGLIPDPIGFLENEPSEIEHYRELGRQSGLEKGINNFYYYLRGLATVELVEKGIMSEEKANNLNWYKVYYKIIGETERGKKIFAAFETFNQKYPRVYRYLIEASIVDFFVGGGLRTLKRDDIEPAFQGLWEELNDKRFKWEEEQNTRYNDKLLDAYLPVVAFCLGEIGQLSGLKIDDLTS